MTLTLKVGLYLHKLKRAEFNYNKNISLLQLSPYHHHYREWIKRIYKEWSVWDVTKRNGNIAEKNPLFYQLMAHIRVGGTPLLYSNTLTHYHSTWPPRRTGHSSYRARKLRLRHVARGIVGVICAKAAVIFCRRSASFCGLCHYTSDLTYSHMKKSGGFKSGEFASHGMGQSRLHQWFLYASSKNYRTVIAQCGGTLHGHPSRSYSNKLLTNMYINFLCTTVYFSSISNGSPCISTRTGMKCTNCGRRNWTVRNCDPKDKIVHNSLLDCVINTLPLQHKN
jgi:hypothetical protein